MGRENRAVVEVLACFVSTSSRVQVLSTQIKLRAYHATAVPVLGTRSCGSQRLSHSQSKQQAPGSANLLFKTIKFKGTLKKTFHIKFWLPHQPIQLNTKIHNCVHMHISHIKRKRRERTGRNMGERNKGWGGRRHM